MKTIAFFNNKGGVGKTTLVYHLAWMYSEVGVSVVAADLDPQANLTAMFLDEDRLEELWPDGDHTSSIQGSISPILRGVGDIMQPHVEHITTGLGLVVGDLGLSRFEAKLSAAWPACLDGDEAAFRTESAFHRTILQAAEARDAKLVLIDVGPNLGAINRAAMIAANFVAVPLLPTCSRCRDCATLALRSGTGAWNGKTGCAAAPLTRTCRCPLPRSTRRDISSCSTPCAWAVPFRHTRSGSLGFPGSTVRKPWAIAPQKTYRRTTSIVWLR